jgi:hypothetical protein
LPRVLDSSPKLAAAVAALVAAASLAACGGEDSESLSLDQWRDRVAPMCSDGIQEAMAVPLPTSRRQVGEDSRAMAEIVLTVHDGILPLGLPDGEEDAAQAYLDQLAADAELLEEIAAAARAGEDFGALRDELDESAGRLALELDLEQCAAFANAVARTP